METRLNRPDRSTNNSVTETMLTSEMIVWRRLIQSTDEINGLRWLKNASRPFSQLLNFMKIQLHHH